MCSLVNHRGDVMGPHPAPGFMVEAAATSDPRARASQAGSDPTLASVAHAYSVAVAHDFRRNAFFTTFWQFLWGLGIAFTMWNTVAPAYLGYLHVSRTTLSLVLAIPWLCMPLQILSSVLFGGHRRRFYLMLTYMLATVPWLVYACASLWFPDRMGPTTRLICFILVSIAFGSGLCLGVPLFFELLTDNTPIVHRGGLAGYRSGAIGVAGLLAGIGARRVTQSWGAPTSFHINFVIGLMIWFWSCLSLLGVRDHVDPTRVAIRRTMREVVRQFCDTTLSLWRDMNCRIYLIFHSLLGVTILFYPMIIEAAGRQLGATPTQQQMFTTVYLVSLIGPAWCIGRLADRFGYRLAAVTIALLMTAGFTLALCFSTLTMWYLGYGLCSLAGSLATTVLGNMCVEMFPQRDPSLLMSTSLTMLLPLVMLCGTLGAKVGDAQGSYSFVFAMGAALAAIAALGFLLLVREPRVGRNYMMSMTQQR